MRSTAALLALLLTGCASAPPPPAEPVVAAVPTFAIVLHRPSAIGDVRQRSTTMTSTRSLLSKSGESLLQQQHDEVHITFVATEKVLDIDERGIATKLEYVVEEAFAESQADRKDLLAVGAILIVTRGVDAPFALEGGSLTAEVESILAMLFTTSKPTRTDDDIFGSDAAQPIGGKWPIRADMAARDLTEAGLTMDSAALTGETELTGVETVGTVECLKISARMKADNMTPPGLQSGDTVEKAYMEASFVGAFPTDGSRQRLSDSSDMTAEIIVLRTVEGHPVRTEMLMKRSRQTIYADAALGTHSQL
jgi:hypothetical protein